LRKGWRRHLSIFLAEGEDCGANWNEEIKTGEARNSESAARSPVWQDNKKTMVGGWKTYATGETRGRRSYPLKALAATGSSHFSRLRWKGDLQPFLFRAPLERYRQYAIKRLKWKCNRAGGILENDNDSTRKEHYPSTVSTTTVIASVIIMQLYFLAPSYKSSYVHVHRCFFIVFNGVLTRIGARSPQIIVTRNTSLYFTARRKKRIREDPRTPK